LVRSYELPWGDESAEPVKDDLSLAVEDLTEALELNPENAELFHERAIVHMHRGDWQAALRDLNTAVDLKGETAGTYCARGRARYEVGDWTGAIDDCSRALDIDSRNERALRLRARAYLKRGLQAEYSAIGGVQ
jgi:Flp pilus assembly protein TadD